MDHANRRKDLKGKEQLDSLFLYELEPCAVQVLPELVALARDHVNASDEIQPVLCTSTNGLMRYETDEQNKTLMTKIFHLEDDPVAKIFWIPKPGIF